MRSRVDAIDMAAGRQNMYFSIFIWGGVACGLLWVCVYIVRGQGKGGGLLCSRTNVQPYPQFLCYQSFTFLLFLSNQHRFSYSCVTYPA